MSVMLPEYAGCEWPIDPACLSETWETEYDTSTRERATALAGLTLRRLTGYRVGGCPIVHRPCPSPCGCLPVDSYGGSGFRPGINMAGQWVNNCGCTGYCACSSPYDYVLPPPVGRVDQVKINGTVVTGWRLDSGGRLVRTDGQMWPFNQNLALPDTAIDTWSITYLNAYPVDLGGAYAAGVLAVEFAKSCKGKSGCRLPNNITAMTRQGVSFEMVTGAFPGGKTGIREVDTWVALWNPDGLRQQPTVWTPDNEVRFQGTP